MTVFENMKAKNIDELAEWLDEYCMFDGSPWYAWFDRKCCKHCEPIIVEGDDELHKDMEYGWCELNGDRCKFFPDMKEVPWGKQLIKMWLESEDADVNGD